MYNTVVALDLKTTGPDPRKHEIIEVAAIVQRDGKITDRFSELVRPKDALPPGMVKSTGIMPSMMKDARSVDAVLGDLMEFLPEDALCIAHDSRLERAFLRRATKDIFKRAVLDTLTLSMICFPDLPEYGLDGYRADADCEATLQLWERCIEHASKLPAPVLREINNVLRPLRKSPIRDLFREISPAGKRRSKKSDVAFTELFRKEQQRWSRRNLTEPIDYETLEGETIAGLLGPEGAFAKVIDEYEHREEQMTMARTVADAFNDSTHLMIEGGTGVGKSLAYLVPSVVWATANETPVIVSTNTKNLQRQLFEKDIPLVRAAMDLDFNSVMIKGRQNYICLRRLLYLMHHTEFELDSDEREEMASVLVWATSTSMGDISECSALHRPGRTDLRSRLTSSGGECFGKGCSQRNQCFLYRVRCKAMQADIVVTNHSVVFADMGMPDTSPCLPNYNQIIFDEAHNLENSATSHFSIEVSTGRIRRILTRLWRSASRKRGVGRLPSLIGLLNSASDGVDPELKAMAVKHAEEMVDAVSDADLLIDPFFDILAGLLGKDPAETHRIFPDRKRQALWDPITAAKKLLVAGLADVMRHGEALEDALQQLASEKFPEHADFARQMRVSVDWIKEVITDIELVLAAEDEEYVFWVQRAFPHYAGVVAWAAPIHVGPILQDKIYSKKQTAVLTSATLTVRGSTKFLEKRLGLDLVEPNRLVQMVIGTPFDYQQQCAVMVPTFLPEPTDRTRDYPTELGELLAEVFRRTHGRAMALFTSYDMLRRSTSVLQEEMLGDDVRILAQGVSGSRSSITAVFKRDLNAVLMGTHSFWEGVDLVGETLSCLVVARLPFAVFTDPVIKARCERIEAGGKDSFLGYSVPNAVIRFRQGFGRLIRSQRDRGIIIVTDRRIVSKRYGEWFRKSIPANVVRFHDRDNFLDSVEEFLG